MRQNSALYILLSLIIYTSCQEVVNPDMPETDSRYVVEATVTDYFNDTSKVKVSHTVPYNADSVQNPVANANVSVENLRTGDVYTFNETRPGLYINADINPDHESEYQLSVFVNDEEIQGTSYMTPRMWIDSVSVIKSEGEAFLEEGYYLRVYAQTPINRINYYRFEAETQDSSLNTRSNAGNIYDDADFKSLPFAVFPLSYNFSAQDTAYITSYSLTENLYNYFFAWQEALSGGGIFSSTPNTPENNLKNITSPEKTPLGYFQVTDVTKFGVAIGDHLDDND